MASVLSPAFLPFLLSAAMMLALALWLLRLDIGKAANRVFAGLLFARAATLVLGPLRATAPDEATYHLYNNLTPYAVLPLVPLTLYFVSVYPRRRWLAKTPLRRWLFLTASLVPIVWYLLDHSAYGTVAQTAPILFASAGAGHHYIDYGPLILLSGLRLPVLGLAALVFARDYVRMPMGAPRYSIFLVCAAFALNALYDGTKFLAGDLIASLASFSGYDWFPWGWVFAVLPSVTLLPAIASLVVIGRHGLTHVDPGPRRVARNFLLACSFPVLTAVLVSVNTGLAVLDSQVLRDFTLGLWRLFVPLLVTYALLRYQLFGIDLRVKAGVRRSILVGIFALTFFVVTEAAENLIADDSAPLVGIASAGVLALASRPLESLGSRAADRMMPDAKPIEAMTTAERRRFYAHQFLLLHEDQDLSEKERRILSRLRRSLGIARKDAEALQRDPRAALQQSEDDAAERAVLRARTLRPEDEDSRIEIVVKGGLVAATIVLSFGMLSEGIETLVPLSSFEAGLVTAAGVALLIGPIQSGAQRLTDRLFPSAQRSRDSTDARRLRLYRDAVHEALADGVMSRRDRVFLGHLREQLGIAKKQGASIEKETRTQMGARRGQTR